MNKLLPFAGLVLSLGVTAPAYGEDASAIPMRDFFRHPERAYFRISGDGRTLSFMQPWERRMNIYVQPVGRAAEPVLIVEIQSPSTERDDHFVKLPHYQALPSLQEILYVESQNVAATLYRRSGAGWETVELEGGNARLRLDTIGLDITLAALYRGVPGLAP